MSVLLSISTRRWRACSSQSVNGLVGKDCFSGCELSFIFLYPINGKFSGWGRLVSPGLKLLICLQEYPPQAGVATKEFLHFGAVAQVFLDIAKLLEFLRGEFRFGFGGGAEDGPGKITAQTWWQTA